ncbi:hypothetical protein ABE79_09445, partial [Proteus mirabilis]
MASHAHSPYLDPASVGFELCMSVLVLTGSGFTASGFVDSDFEGSGLTAVTEGCFSSPFGFSVIDCVETGFSAGFSTIGFSV